MADGLNPSRRRQTTFSQDWEALKGTLSDYYQGLKEGRWATPYANVPATDFGQRAEQLGTAAEAVRPTFGMDWDYSGAQQDIAAGNYGQAALKLAGGVGSAATDVMDLVEPGSGTAMSTLAAAPLAISRTTKKVRSPTGKIIDVPTNNPPGDPLTDMRVAQRVPTVKGTPEDIGSTQDLRINVDAMRQDPAYFEKATTGTRLLGPDGQPIPILAKGEPTGQYRENPLEKIIPEKVAGSKDPEERVGAAKGIILSNLRSLYDRLGQKDPTILQRSTNWYPGGHQLALDLSKKAGIPHNAAAGALAALSPQTDWFQNIDMARRMVDTMVEDPVITREMVESFVKNGPAGLAKAGLKLDEHVGKRWSQLPDFEAGIAAVAHDLQTRPRSYQTYGPEGMQLGVQKTGKGEPQQLGWQNTTNLHKAVAALRSGGDMSIISDAMGDQHKVRNFYNNLIAPWGSSPGNPQLRYDDYTSDTHNVAAGLLRPLAGSDVTTDIALGGSKGPKSGATGAKGTYGIFADAGREAAEGYGVTPFQVQSPTWEAVRGLFPAAAKRPEHKQAINDIWEEFRQGKMTLRDAQAQVYKYAEERMKGDVTKVPWR